MIYYAGIDVSLELSSVCVVDASGKIVRESKVTSEPEALLRHLALLWHFGFDGGCEELLTMRTPERWRPGEELEDGLLDGWHARFRRRPAASFFSVPLR